jgi:small GTP-binding protein
MNAVQKKVCLLGDFAVGKTSLIRRYIEDRFEDKHLSTIGVKISRKTLQRPEYALNLLIWDLAGGDDIDQLSRRYLLGAVGAILVCDLTRPETLEITKHYVGVMQTVNSDSVLVLAGNKVDLEEERAIDADSLAATAGAMGVPWLLTSAKSGLGVEDAFDMLASGLEDQE